MRVKRKEPVTKRRGPHFTAESAELARETLAAMLPHDWVVAVQSAGPPANGCHLTVRDPGGRCRTTIHREASPDEWRRQALRGF